MGFVKREMPTSRKLEIIIDLIETGQSPLAMHLTEQWGKNYRVIDPAIAKFVTTWGDNPKKYWMEYEPMLSDLKAEWIVAKSKE